MKKHSPLPLSIKNILQSAFGLLKGSKLSLNINFLAILAIFIVVYFLLDNILAQYIQPLVIHAQESYIYNLLLKATSLIYLIIMSPFFAGIFMASIKRARGESLAVNSGLLYFNHWLPTAITVVIVAILTAVITDILQILLTLLSIQLFKLTSSAVIIRTIFVLVYTLAIFLSFAVNSLFMFSIPALIDQHKNPVTAIITSIRLVLPHWLKMTALLVILFILGMLMMLPFTAASNLLHFTGAATAGFIITLIGLAYFLPFLALCLGVAYDQLC